MFNLNVLQNQWLMLALIGGTALMFTLLLAYPAIWRPRKEPSEDTAQEPTQPLSVLAWLRSFMPWILIVVYAAAAVYVVIYTWMAAVNPPNW
jgi:hypothetical protein